MQCWNGNCHISQMSALCNWRSVLCHMVIGHPNYSKSLCCNIILHCNTSTSATANLTHSVKMTVHFSWLNFSSKITLYQAYFPNRFKISAAIISAISSFIFTHIEPTLMTKKIFNIFYSQHSQVTHSRHTIWHLISHIHIYLSVLAHTRHHS